MPDLNRAKLIATRVPRRPRGIVLVLHGGASRQQGMGVSPAQLSVLRMIPIARRIAHAGHGELAVYRLLNSVRGWDAHHTPVDDVRWALGELRERHGADMPVCLVGHSLGGRAALLSAGEHGVVAVAALAAFVYPQDGSADAGGRKILFVHGDADRIAPLGRAQQAARAAQRTADVEFVVIEGGKHAMLRHHAAFDGAAARFAAATVLA